MHQSRRGPLGLPRPFGGGPLVRRQTTPLDRVRSQLRDTPRVVVKDEITGRATGRGTTFDFLVRYPEGYDKPDKEAGPGSLRSNIVMDDEFTLRVFTYRMPPIRLDDFGGKRAAEDKWDELAARTTALPPGATYIRRLVSTGIPHYKVTGGVPADYPPTDAVTGLRNLIRRTYAGFFDRYDYGD